MKRKLTSTVSLSRSAGKEQSYALPDDGLIAGDRRLLDVGHYGILAAFRQPLQARIGGEQKLFQAGGRADDEPQIEHDGAGPDAEPSELVDRRRREADCCAAQEKPLCPTIASRSDVSRRSSERRSVSTAPEKLRSADFRRRDDAQFGIGHARRGQGERRSRGGRRRRTKRHFQTTGPASSASNVTA